MIDFHGPAVEVTDALILSKFWHLMSGLFIWEFITNLDFEWSIIQGRHRYRWTIWVYSLSRVSALVAVIDNLVLLNVNTAPSCQLAATLAWLPSYLALSAASFLVVLRIVAIWNKNRVVVVISAVVWAINSVFFIQGLSRIRYTADVSKSACVVLNIQITKVTVTAAFVTDMLLLVIMLVGLFRLGCHRHGAFATGRFLWNQGIIWLLLAVAAGVLPTVFIYLDLNTPLSTIFLFPWIITMSIAATRMYRGLDDFLSSDINHSPHVPSNLNDSGQTISISRAWVTSAMPIPLNGIRVEVDKAHHHSMTSESHAIRHGLGSDVDRQLHDKPNELV